MLRLQPSEIALTPNDVTELKQRLQLRQAIASQIHRRLLTNPSYYTSTNMSVAKIRRGPERLRDDSLIDTAFHTSPSSATSSDGDELSNDSDYVHGSTQSMKSNCFDPHFNRYSEDQEVVLRHGTDSSGRDFVVTGLRGDIDEQMLRQSEKGPVSNCSDFNFPSEKSTESGISNSLDGVRSQLKLAPEGEQGLQQGRDGQNDEIIHPRARSTLGHMADYVGRSGNMTHHLCRFRPRSLSDPMEGMPPWLVFNRRCSIIDEPESYSLPDSPQEELFRGDASDPSGSALHAEYRTPYDFANIAPAQARLHSNTAHFESTNYPWSTTIVEPVHGRHHSLPNATVGDIRPSSAPLMNLRKSSNSHLGSKHVSERSRMLEILRDGSSPLDELARGATAWTADLPFRSGISPHNTGRLVSFDEIGATPVGGLGVQVGTQDSSYTNPPRQWFPETPLDIEAIRLRGGHSMTYDFAISRGGRPRMDSSQRQGTVFVRRRYDGRREQENDDDVHALETERRQWHHRSISGRDGGVMEHTPPPSGRFERFL